MLRTREGYAAACGFPDDIMDAMFKDIEAAFHYQPRPDAIAYDDGAEWDLGGGVKVTAVHMPGHTSGHCVLLIDPVEVAFLGDIDLTGFGPYYGDATSSLSDFRRTLKRVPDLPASVWVTSHHRGVYTDRAEMLSALAAFSAKIDQRSETLLQRIRERPCTLASLVAQRLTYPPHYTPSWVPVVEQRTISLHLDELMAAGEIALEDERYFVLA